MFHSLKPLAFAVLLLAAPATPAAAQEFRASIGSHSKNVSWSARFGTRRGPEFGISIRPGYRRQDSCSSRRIWIPGHHERVARQVWVPGRTHREWIPPVYQTRYDDCGRGYEVIVRDGYWHESCEPGRYETRYEDVWTPGHYEKVRY